MVKKMTLTGTLLKWGNSYGIRVSKADVERLQLVEKQQVELHDIRPARNPLKELAEANLHLHLTREELKKHRDAFWKSKWDG